MKTKNLIMGLILIILGGIFQNFCWYLRLQTPILLKEFQIYWIRDGPKLFLDYNIMNYFFLVLLLILYMIIYLIEKRKLRNDKLQN